LPWVATFPKRVRSVFLLNTVFQRDYRWHHWARTWQTPVIGELAIYLAPRAALRREMKQHAPGVSRELVDQTYDRMHWSMRRTLLRTYRSHKHPATVFDPWEQRLLAVLQRLPTRVVWGDRDPYIPKHFADRFGVAAIHLPDYGHWAHLQAPGVVAQHLVDFWCHLPTHASE